jgi:hypothetical protein
MASAINTNRKEYEGMFEIKTGHGVDYQRDFYISSSSWSAANEHIETIFKGWARFWDSHIGDYATIRVATNESCVAQGSVLSKPFWLARSPVVIDGITYARVDILCRSIVDDKKFSAGAFFVNAEGDVCDETGAVQIAIYGTPSPYWLLLCNVFKAVMDANVIRFDNESGHPA